MPNTSLVRFNIEKADVLLNAQFGAQFWSLFHNIPAFYSSLLRGLRDLGLTSSAIRSDTGDGSLGAYNVNFWLFDFKALVRIKLERLEIEFRNLIAEDVERLDLLCKGLLPALASTQSDFLTSSYSVDVHLHGEPEGLTPKEYLGRFVAAVPTGLGPLLGTGSIFYFGEQIKTPSRSVAVDLSGVMPGKLYVRLLSFREGAINPDALKASVEESVVAGLSAVGLSR